jgi:hypothetical protein
LREKRRNRHAEQCELLHIFTLIQRIGSPHAYFISTRAPRSRPKFLQTLAEGAKLGQDAPQFVWSFGWSEIGQVTCCEHEAPTNYDIDVSSP